MYHHDKTKYEESSVVEHILKLEEPFFLSNEVLSTQEPFTIVKGFNKIMLSAPHCTKHFRNGKVYNQEIYTGALVKYLNEVSGCSVVYANNSLAKDYNYEAYQDNDYQKQLVDFVNKNKIEVVIDIHGSRKEHPYIIEAGTLGTDNPSLKGNISILSTLATELNFVFKNEDTIKPLGVNKVFTGGLKQDTVTKAIYENTKASAIQIEINKMYRDENNEFRFIGIISVLERWIGILMSTHSW